MNKFFSILIIVLFLFVGSSINQTVLAQDFDFVKLQKKANDFTVIIDITIEISFGMNNTTQKEQFLGTIVTEQGLVIFNGFILANESGMGMHGFSMKTEPGEIEIRTSNGDVYDAEFIGVDQYSNIGFLQIISNATFIPVKFKQDVSFEIGSWLSLYMLLPDFIDPPLAADIGMIASNLISPEKVPLTIGFNNLQLHSVLFNENLEPVGILGRIFDRSRSGDNGGFSDNMREFGMPLLGVIVAERLEKIIANPPQRGNGDRGWLGITLQALTDDMAEFWNIESSGGIIVNEVVPNSPAAKGNLQVGDIIFAINGLRVEVDREEKIPIFQRSIAEQGPGTQLELSVLRPIDDSMDSLSLLVELGKAPIAAKDAPEYENEKFEFTVRSLVFSDYMLLNQNEETFKGVRLSEIKQGGLTDIGGLNIGDIIQRIDNEGVTTIEDVERIMTTIEQEQPREIIFFIWRNNKTMFVNVKTDW